MERFDKDKFLEVLNSLDKNHAAISRKTMIQEGTISKWYNTNQLPNIENVIAISEAYGISVDKLLGTEAKEELKASEICRMILKIKEAIPLQIIDSKYYDSWKELEETGDMGGAPYEQAEVHLSLRGTNIETEEITPTDRDIKALRVASFLYQCHKLKNASLPPRLLEGNIEALLKNMEETEENEQ